MEVKDPSIKSFHIGVLGIKGLPSKGGGERVAEAIIEEAVKNGFKVTVYGKKDYNDSTQINSNIRLISIPYLKGKHLGAFTYGLFSSIHSLLFGNYDLIHLHCADYGYVVPLLRLRYKILGTSHGAEYNRDKWNRFAKLFFRISEALFVRYTHICTSVSLSLKDYYQLKYRRKVYFIPNGIRMYNKRNKMSVDLSKYNLPEKYILFAAGRIIPSKGCDILLKAYNNLSYKIPLVIVGNLNDNVQYYKYISNLANDKVTFIDFIADKSVLYEIVSKCQFFIFPSTYEAMSMMLLEVANLKKCIVCSDIPQNYDAIGDNAIYFKSGDHSDLALKLSYAFNNVDKVEELGMKVYNWVKNNRNWQDLVSQYFNLYQILR